MQSSILSSQDKWLDETAICIVWQVSYLEGTAAIETATLRSP